MRKARALTRGRWARGTHLLKRLPFNPLTSPLNPPIKLRTSPTPPSFDEAPQAPPAPSAPARSSELDKEDVP